MKCYAPISIPDPRYNKSAIRLSVPCNKCVTCLQNRANDWSIRLREEAKYSTSSHFITLTYSDETICFKEKVDPDTGEILYVQTVVKKHLQDYIKRLRNVTDQKLRYYAISEYGGLTLRPHYHMLMFNLPNDLTHEYANRWPFGHVYIGDVTPSSIQYVAQYHVTKNVAPPGAEPNFALMSRKPGIGYQYLEKMKEWHDTGYYDRDYYPQKEVKRRLPRYYRDKLFDDSTREHLSSMYELEEDERTPEQRMIEVEEIIRRSKILKKTKI